LSFVRMIDHAVPRTVQIRAREAVGPLRLAAEDGLEVQCQASAAYAAECRVDSLPAGGELLASVRGTRPLMTGEVRILRVFSGSHVDTVSFANATVSEPLGVGQQISAVPPASLPGTYRGFAELLSSEVTEPGVAPALAPSTSLRVPLEARVHAPPPGVSQAIVELEDALQVFAPQGHAIGRLSLGATEDQLLLPAAALIELKALADDPTEIIIETSTATGHVVGGGTSVTMTFDLTRRYGGVLDSSRRPTERWRLVLSRSGELPAGASAPALPPPAVLRYPAARAKDFTRWEQLMHDAIIDNSAGGFSFVSLLQSHGGLDPWLDLCERRTDQELQAFATASFPGFWATDYVTSPAGVYGSIAAVDVADLPPSNRPLRDRFFENLRTVGPFSAGIMEYAIVHPNTFPVPSTYSVAGGGTIDRAIPCALDFRGAINQNVPIHDTNADGDCVSFPQSVHWSFAPGSMDACAQAQAYYECDVVDVEPTLPGGAPANASFNFIFLNHTNYPNGIFNCSWRGEGELTATIKKVCRLPRVSTFCADAALCYQVPPPSPFRNFRSESLASQLISGEVLPVSGDLRCEGDTGAVAFDLDQNAELPNTDAHRMKAAKVLEVCIADLERLKSSPAPAAPSGTNGDALELLLGQSQGCFDAARMLFTLGFLGEGLREGETDPYVGDRLRTAAIYQRLLQRFIQLHAFLARETIERERLAQVLRREPEPGMAAPRPLREMLDRSMAGWGLVLHPRFATPLDSLSGEALAAPDYRPLVAGGPIESQLHHEQTAGIATAIVEGIDAQLTLAEVRLDHSLFTGEKAVIGPTAAIVRQSLVLTSIARTLHDRAVRHRAAVGGSAPAWSPRFLEAERAVSRTLERVVGKMFGLFQGRNPFGIEDSDLPLYLFGTEQGAGGRFAAISDFLLGGGPASTAWAPTAWRAAQTAITNARTAWLQQQDRALLIAQDEAETSGRSEDIARRYGEQILELCGGDRFLSTEVLERWTDFNSDTCYIRTEDPRCRVSASDYFAALGASDLPFQACLLRAARQEYGAPIGYRSPALNALLDSPTCQLTLNRSGCGSSAAACLSCGGAGPLVDVDPTMLFDVELVGVPQERLDKAEATCLGAFPGARTRLPTLSEVRGDIFDSGACYQGSIGEAVLSAVAVAQEVEIARSELSNLSDAYNIAMRSCIILQTGNAGLESALAAHNETMSKLRAGKLAADIVANVAGGVKDCLSTLSGVDGLATVGSGGATAGLAAGSCAAAGAEAAAESVSDGLQFAMDEAQAGHDALMMMLQNDIDERRCFTDAELNLVGSRTASLRISKAIQELNVARFQISEMKSSASGLFAEGRAALSSALGRVVRPMSQDYWLSESIDDYSTKFRQAQRLAYLAVRAVEYEFQGSLRARADVLAAEVPADLEFVLQTLWSTSATRGINGARPTNLKAVVSVRRHLLQLADHAGYPASSLPLSDVDRFRLLLQSPRYAVYDDGGEYLGQQIPFTLAPLDTLGLGESQGIGIYADTDCAERIWSVNASVLGSGPLFRGDDTTFTRLDLLKANTFYSQWCTPPGPGEPQFQLASVRPTRNLFREPSLGGEFGTQLGTNNRSGLYSRARIQPVFNVPRGEFEADQYANGETSELAARGMYGDYALFIPASRLSLPLASGEYSDGLVLNEVEDILLRFDYVSVAR